MKFTISSKIPVLVCGMWKAHKDIANSGAKILIQDSVSNKVLLQGFSDVNGDFRAFLPSEIKGKRVKLVILETCFEYQKYESVKVERFGLFLPVKARKDLNYIGDSGAKKIDLKKWEEWIEAEEFAIAAEKTHSAARRAKMLIPMPLFGMLIGLLTCLCTAGFGMLTSGTIGIIVTLVFNIITKKMLLNGH
jgi:hypothetical protein